jgi:perosamine synthetase
LPLTDALSKCTLGSNQFSEGPMSSYHPISSVDPPGRQAQAGHHQTDVSSASQNIPLSTPFFTGREQLYVQSALNGGWISGAGDYVSKFESLLAAITGRDHVIAVANGTMALELALRALGIGPGNEVIVPAFTFAAPMLSVLAVGAEPVIVDVDPMTWTIDVDEASRRVTRATRAIIAVDVLGHPCDYLKLERTGVPIIQDCAEAHGALHRGKPAGSQGLVSVFSFHANKAITTGEGGSAGTDDEVLADKMRLLANHGMSRSRPYSHPVVGRNYRMTNLTAAVGLAQAEAWEELVHARSAVADRYRSGLAGIGIEEPGTATWATRSTWLHTIATQHREEVVTAARACGIDARAVWPPLHRQPVLTGTTQACEEHLVAEWISSAALWLPTAAGMSGETVDRVVNLVAQAVAASARQRATTVASGRVKCARYRS